jgi:glutathione synthase/RimK-type ligase-like ATP-grasp enzyme
VKIDLHLWTQAPQAYTNKRLAEEAHKMGLNVYLESTRSTPTRPNSGSLLILRSTGLDYIDYDIRLAELWGKDNRLFSANRLDWTLLLRDKLQGSKLLSQLHLPALPTYSLSDPDLITSLESIKEGLIVKPMRSNQGKGLFIIDSLSSLKTVARAWKDLGDTRFVVQPRLKKKREWRVLGLPDKDPLWILRSPRHEDEVLGNRAYSLEALFDSNKEQGTWELEKLLKEKLRSLNYWGADIIETITNQFFVLEVNASPGLQGAEELTHENLSCQLLNSLIDTLPDKL